MRKFSKDVVQEKFSFLIVSLAVILSTLISGVILRFKLSYIAHLIEIVDGGGTKQDVHDFLRLSLLSAVIGVVLLLAVLTFLGYLFDIDEYKWKTKKGK